ncbi:unnamed protein product [Paramecium primaurelia]|uniref:Chromo domain-containing protein n=1 Tax=Paramecium primaurelia TaxID=5886 RepID=A0A8S1M8Q8_PARPR|nr:unnamed protein product [Paramecium primaurelia]
MKNLNHKNNHLAINETQFIYGKKLVKNNYYYAVKWSGQSISHMSWEKQSNFTEESSYLIRRFETRICYLFFNKKIYPSQDGIRVHVKGKFCQVYISKVNQKSKSIQDHQWKIQNISNKFISTQSIINQNLKDVTLNTQDSKLDSKRVVVEFAHLPPFIGDKQIKQMIVTSQSITNLTQVVKQESTIQRDIKLLNQIEKAQKIINEQQKYSQIEVQNEQQKLNNQKSQIQNNNKIYKKNSKKANSNEQKNTINKLQQTIIQNKQESSKIIMKRQTLDQEKKQKQQFQSSSEIISIENDNESFQLELFNFEENFDNKQVNPNISQTVNQNDNRNSQSILERPNKELKKEKCRAVKSGNLLSFQNINTQKQVTSIITSNNNNNNNDNTYQSINHKLNNYQNNFNDNSNFNDNNSDNDNKNNLNRQQFINKNDSISSINPFTLYQNNNYSEEKKFEKDASLDQIISQKQNENDNLDQIIFKEPKQQIQVKTSQQIQQEIQRLHLDRIAQNKPSRCSVPIIPKIKDVEIQVYLIDNNQLEMIQYDQELNQIKSHNIIITTICSHQLMNEQLFFQCKYDNGVEYFVEFDELKVYSPKKLLDYMKQNSIFI